MNFEVDLRPARMVALIAFLLAVIFASSASADQAAKRSANEIQTAELTDLASKLRETSAIGPFVKLSMKSELDQIISDVPDASNRGALGRLEMRFYRLIRKVSAHLRGGAPELSNELLDKRSQIWAALMANSVDANKSEDRFSRR